MPGPDVHDPRTGRDLTDAPASELVRRLAEETTELVRGELRLARAEMTQKAQQAGIAGGLFGGAGVAGLLALGTLTAALVLALATGMDAWLAALIVGVVWAIAAGVAAMLGREKAREAVPPIPEQTIDDVKEDAAWLRQKTRQ